MHIRSRMSSLKRVNNNWTRFPFGIDSSYRYQSQLAPPQTAVNNNLYSHPSPSKPVVAISIDGCDVKHFDQCLNTSSMPHLQSIVATASHNRPSKGFMASISTVFPTCARVNQVSIVTGLTPDNHGITGTQCMEGDITDSDSLFCDSVLTELSHNDVGVLFMCIAEQYREQLTYDFHPNSMSLSLQLLAKYLREKPIHISDKLDSLIQFILSDNQLLSSLKPLVRFLDCNDDDTLLLQDVHGECGLFLLEILQKIMTSSDIDTPALSYLALTPASIQYHFDHRTPQMLHYLSKIDSYLKFFDAQGCRYGVTSAHGANYKLAAHGGIAVINLEQKLKQCWTEYAAQCALKDVCDTFEYRLFLQRDSKQMLYGFAHIHIVCKNEHERDMVQVEQERKKLIFHTLCWLRGLKGVYSSIGHDEACSSLELPPERIGEVLLLADMDTVFCDDCQESESEATKNNAAWRLSHGSLEENTVPLIMNERPTDAYMTMLTKGKARTYHLFDVLLNGYDPSLQHQCPYQYTPSQYQYVGR